MSNEPPTTDDLWDAALVNAGFVDPRNGAPSNSALAAKIGSNPTTIARMRAGTRVPKPDTVKRIADALKISVKVLSGWVDQARTIEAPYVAPPEADLLSREERKALDQLIRVMAASKVGVKPQDETSEDQPLRVVPRIAASPPPIAASRRNKETSSD